MQMPSATIRKLEKADIPAAIALGLTNWPNDERIAESLPLELSDMFSNAAYRPTFFVAEVGDRIVGLGGWNWAWHNYDIYELFWGNVASAYQGLGIGRQLVEARLYDIAELVASIPEARQSYVTISTHHRAMYERYGFGVIATMDLWQDPQTHLMMKKL